MVALFHLHLLSLRRLAESFGKLDYSATQNSKGSTGCILLHLALQSVRRQEASGGRLSKSERCVLVSWSGGDTFPHSTRRVASEVRTGPKDRTREKVTSQAEYFLARNNLRTWQMSARQHRSALQLLGCRLSDDTASCDRLRLQSEVSGRS